MTISRLHNGAYEISAMVNGYRVARTYYGYTRREAQQAFRHDVRGM